MKLERASGKAMRFACLNFHYSKKMPLHNLGYSVFNDKSEWCGVVMYGRGASPVIGSPFGLKAGEFLELQRVALNGKQESTSKTIAISLKLVKKDCPLLKAIISYADGNQKHIGIIYQATNWIFTGAQKSGPKFKHKITGKDIHSRMVKTTGAFSPSDLAIGRRYTYKECDKIPQPEPKYRYVYLFDTTLKASIKHLIKPYPKKQICDNSITANAAAFQVAEEGQHHLIAQSK